MKKICFLLILLMFLGCTSKNNDFNKHFIQNSSFDLDHEILKDVNFYSYHFEDDSILTFPKNDKLIGFDLKTGKEIFNPPLPGQKGFNYIYHLYHNQDSIFICSIINYDMHLLLMNSNGEVYNRWDITNKAMPKSGLPFYIDADQSHPMILKKDQLFFQASNHQNPKTTTNTQIPIEAILDLNTGQLKQFGSLPSTYGEGNFYGNHQYESARIINDKSEMVFSFPSCHNLYFYNMDGEFLRTLKCKSKFIESFEPIKADLPAIIDAYGYNARYSDLIYDRYRKLYYRVVLHKLDKYDKNNHKTDASKREWSIMVLDKDFNLKTEVIMPVGSFWKRQVATKQGIIFKTDNDNQSNTFQLFETCIN